ITQNPNLGTDPNDWKKSGVEVDQVFAELEKRLAEATARTDEFEEKLVALASGAGKSKEEIETMVSAMDQGGVEFIKAMAEFGSDGASLLGLDSTFLDNFGNQWAEKAIAIQTELDKLTGEERNIAIN